MTQPHQPGQAVFRSVLPEDIVWKSFPAFPPEIRLAVIVGEPSAPAPYVIRVKVPADGKLMPHRHPEDRIYTVMSGVFNIGLGDRFDGGKVAAYPPGSVIVLPGNTLALPLGQIRRIRHPGHGDRSVGPRIPGSGRRSARDRAWHSLDSAEFPEGGIKIKEKGRVDGKDKVKGMKRKKGESKDDEEREGERFVN